MHKNSLLLLFFILVGAILGGIIGEVFNQYVPFLNVGQSIGFAPTTIDLSLIQFTIGFTMKLNLAGIIGIFLAVLGFKKL